MARVVSRGSGLIVLEVIFTLIITLAVIGRFWSIRIQRRAVFTSDYLVVVAWAAATSFNGTILWSCANGLGGTSTQLTPDQLAVQAKSLFAATFTWTTATVCCKLSALFLYMQIFDCKTTFRVACRILIALCVAYEIAFIPVFVTQCTPPQASWTGKGKCRKVEKEEMASVIGNLILDTAVVVLPLPYIWSLQMPIAKKLGISAIFSLGIAIVAIICWRLAFTVKLDSGKIDGIYGTYTVAMQSTLEVSLGIIAACMPTLKALGTTLKDSTFATLLTSLRFKSSKASKSGKSDYSSRPHEENHNAQRSGFRKLNASPSDETELAVLKYNDQSGVGTRGRASPSSHDGNWDDPNNIGVLREVDVEAGHG